MPKSLKIAIISPHFPPAKTSTANQINALARELSASSEVSVITYHTEGPLVVHHDLSSQLSLCSIRSTQLFSSSVLIRFLIEFSQPWLSLLFLLIFNRRVLFGRYDYVLIWSPPVLNVPLAWLISVISKAPLILLHRDVFPQWALDVGLIKSKTIYRLLSIFEHFQYLMSDLICIQSPSNTRFITRYAGVRSSKVVYLPNWSDDKNIEISQLPVSIQKLIINAKRIVLYAGTIGPAQGNQALQDLIHATKDDPTITFIILGRGLGMQKLQRFIHDHQIKNVHIHEQIPENQLLTLQSLCDVGLIILNPSHTTTNIPGKYISYLRSGLPVLALINSSNSLIDEINSNCLGIASSSTDVSVIQSLLHQVLDSSFDSSKIRQFFISNYSTASIVQRLSSFFSSL